MFNNVLKDSVRVHLIEFFVLLAIFPTFIFLDAGLGNVKKKKYSQYTKWINPLGPSRPAWLSVHNLIVHFFPLVQLFSFSSLIPGNYGMFYSQNIMKIQKNVKILESSE